MHFRLSTPSFGITVKKKRKVGLIGWWMLSTPSLGITSEGLTSSLIIIEELSTPSLGITRS
jgi:hypothetical protein